jgi:hypothetical protein
VFAPLKALATTGSDSDPSSLARLEEVRNLLYTFSASHSPVLGTGWGVPYQKITSVYANFGPEFWQYAYLPHNSVLGLATFSGLLGLTVTWLVIPMSAFLAMRSYRSANGFSERVGALAALTVLPAYGAQCYGDIGLQSLTCALIFGLALAVSGKVAAWTTIPAGAIRHSSRPGPGFPPVRAYTERAARSIRG